MFVGLFSKADTVVDDSLQTRCALENYWPQTRRRKKGFCRLRRSCVRTGVLYCTPSTNPLKALGQSVLLEYCGRLYAHFIMDIEGN